MCGCAISAPHSRIEHGQFIMMILYAINPAHYELLSDMPFYLITLPVPRISRMSLVFRVWPYLLMVLLPLSLVQAPSTMRTRTGQELVFFLPASYSQRCAVGVCFHTRLRGQRCLQYICYFRGLRKPMRQISTIA